MRRLFVALRPPRAVRDCLLSVQGGVEHARWQDRDQLHLTLRFVGEVDRHRAEDLAHALAAVDAAGFCLSVRGVGHFARKGRPSALWAALAPSPGLELLAGRVERACRSVGLPPETRRFVPHVTLARLPGGAVGAGEWLARHGDLTAPAWPVAAFRFYESHLGSGGSVYTCVAEWPLSPAEGSAD
jgi:2'-5' RNA ligase